MTADSTSGTWADYVVANLNKYWLVGLQASVNNTNQMLWINNGNTSNFYIVETWESTRRIRGGFSINWSSNKVRVRYLDANNVVYSTVFVSAVYGFIKK